MNECWKRLAETSAKWRTAEERLTEAEAPFWNRGVCEEAGSTGYESDESFVGQESSPCSETTTMHEDSTDGEEMKRQQRMKVMKDMTKKIKRRMDAENRWFVAAADCEKAWLIQERKKPCKKAMFGWRK